MWPKSAIIDKLVSQKKNLFKQGVFRSDEQSKAEQQIGKMTKLLRQYDAENKFLYKKVEQLIRQNQQLNNRKSKPKNKLISQLNTKFVKKEKSEFIKNNYINSRNSQNFLNKNLNHHKQHKEESFQIGNSVQMPTAEFNFTLNPEDIQQQGSQLLQDLPKTLLISPKQKLFDNQTTVKLSKISYTIQIQKAQNQPNKQDAINNPEQKRMKSIHKIKPSNLKDLSTSCQKKHQDHNSSAVTIRNYIKQFDDKLQKCDTPSQYISLLKKQISPKKKYLSLMCKKAE